MATVPAEAVLAVLKQLSHDIRGADRVSGGMCRRARLTCSRLAGCLRAARKLL